MEEKGIIYCPMCKNEGENIDFRPSFGLIIFTCKKCSEDYTLMSNKVLRERFSKVVKGGE